MLYVLCVEYHTMSILVVQLRKTYLLNSSSHDKVTHSIILNTEAAAHDGEKQLAYRFSTQLPCRFSQVSKSCLLPLTQHAVTFRRNGPMRLTGCIIAYCSMAFLISIPQDSTILGIDQRTQDLKFSLNCRKSLFHSIEDKLLNEKKKKKSE